jgi:hypothetical protein
LDDEDGAMAEFDGDDKLGERTLMPPRGGWIGKTTKWNFPPETWASLA